MAGAVRRPVGSYAHRTAAESRLVRPAAAPRAPAPRGLRKWLYQRSTSGGQWRPARGVALRCPAHGPRTPRRPPPYAGDLQSAPRRAPAATGDNRGRPPHIATHRHTQSHGDTGRGRRALLCFTQPHTGARRLQGARPPHKATHRRTETPGCPARPPHTATHGHTRSDRRDGTVVTVTQLRL